MTGIVQQPLQAGGTAVRGRSDLPPLSITAVGMSLGLFFAISYVLCVLYGLVGPAQGMHQLLPMLLPGFQWLTWPSFFLGLALSFAYGWYVAVVFVTLFNFFTRRRAKG